MRKKEICIKGLWQELLLRFAPGFKEEATSENLLGLKEMYLNCLEYH